VAVVVVVKIIKTAFNVNKTTEASSTHPRINMMAATVTIMIISEVVATRNSQIM
jgi:hypothetical protein